MPTASVDGTSLEYEVVGDGEPTCLVLHGWPGTDHTYLRPDLDRLAERARLVYYDHRGNGRSGRPDLDTLTVERLAGDAVALADHLGVERFVALGHAHGGCIAQELALAHQERVAGLVLVATTPGELGRHESLLDDPGAVTPPEVDVLQRVPPATDDELSATMRVLARYFLHRPDPEVVDGIFARTTFDAAAARRSMQVLGWWSVVDRLADVRPPVLVLAGRHDVFFPPRHAERIAKAVGRGAEVAVLEDSGHLPWLEEPDAFLACTAGWLDGPAGGVGTGGG